MGEIKMFEEVVRRTLLQIGNEVHQLAATDDEVWYVHRANNLHGLLATLRMDCKHLAEFVGDSINDGVDSPF